MFRKIVAEMLHFFAGSGLECRQDGEIYEVRSLPSRWRRVKQSWRLQFTDGEVREALREPRHRLDVFLSLHEIPGDLREFLGSRNVTWIDISSKEQARVSNVLGDEVSSFLKRYGVRTARYPRISAGFSRAAASPAESKRSVNIA
jgi:hypothetical protein